MIETSLANGSTPSSASSSATRNARSSELRPSVALSFSVPDRGADLTDALCQDRADSVVHDGFDLRERRRSQHVMPPSTTRVCPVMKDAWSEARK